MLIEFRVKNFLSIQDEQVLSLVAGSQKEHKSNTFEPENEKFSLLKSVAIYGANAAGKSNFIKAFIRIKHFVTQSASWQRGDKLLIIPFFLGKNENEPTEFEVSFITQNIRYRYGFSVTRERIVEEWLYAYPNGREQEWFLRSYDKKNKKEVYKFGKNFLGEKELWKNTTRDNALFLSTAIQLNSEQLKPVFDWFFYIGISLTDWFSNSLEISVEAFKNNPQQILDYLKRADLDIEFLEINENKVEIDNSNKLLNKLGNTTDTTMLESDIKTIHLNQQGRPTVLNMILESDGTQKFFKFLGPILDTLQNGRVLVVDELHNHLHPAMTRFIISLFHNEKINTKNAQLIFTTHETSVLNKDIFRKDQIYFCEKRNKATKIYSLSDFKGLRENIDYEKSYLLGRFGALPNLQEI
ncbi:AAA family ATPase [Campylobacter troglodytis]|uniref:AAA family ATPase n=1 Tax=Campylobacter troglodytis TaxID=654363 RepID=UPI00115AB644|nr:ATP-binding protein [Campylobacter troglodytis]TQR61524.1 ATP-binding protein [Campylobacter troglodytis]